MSRNASLAVGLVLIGGLLWVALAWPTAGVDERVDVQVEAPTPEPAPQPTSAPAQEPVVKAPAPAAAAQPQAAPEPVSPPEPVLPPGVEPPLSREQGPVAEYKALFESEPRASSAIEVESSVKDAFVQPGMPVGMLKSVMCRQTVCKAQLKLDWSSGNLGSYVAGVTRLMSNFTSPVAMSPQGTIDGDGVRSLDLYLKLRPPDQRGAPIMGVSPAPSPAEDSR